MDVITIIEAQPSHIFLLRNLAEETFYDSFAKDNEPQDIQDYINASFSLTQIEKDLNEPGSIFLIAYVNKTPAGYARLRKPAEQPAGVDGNKQIELQRIYVRQSLIGKGLGKELMQKSIDLARKHAYDVMWLGVWEHNHRAIDFYTSWGFKKFGSHNFQLGKDSQTDILMKIDL